MQRLPALLLIGLLLTSCGKEPHGIYRGNIDEDFYELDFRTNGELLVTEANNFVRQAMRKNYGDSSAVEVRWIGSWRLESGSIKTYKENTLWKSFRFDVHDLIDEESRARLSHQ